MNLWRVLYTFLSVFIVAASCSRVLDFRQPKTKINTLAQYLHTNITPSLDDGNESNKEGGNETPKYMYTLTKGKETCILANMKITISVPYEKDDATREIKNVMLPVPSNATVNGTCSSVVSEMTLSWTLKEGKNVQNTIRFTFLNDYTNFSVFSVDVNIYLDEKNFPKKKDSKDRYIASSDRDLRLFTASVIKGIHTCKKKEISIKTSKISIEDVELIAFNNDNDGNSRDEKVNCEDQKDENKTFNYIVRDENGKECLLAKMSTSLNVFYWNSKHTISNKTIDILNSAEVSGVCMPERSIMKLSWKPEGGSINKNATNEIEFYFKRTNQITHLDLVTYKITLDDKKFADAFEVIKIGYGVVNMLSAPAQNGMYSCSHEIRTKVMDVEIIIKDVFLVAFDVDQDFYSKNVKECNIEDEFMYAVKDADHQIPCTAANMIIDISIPYQTKEKKETVGQLRVPSTAIVNGACPSSGDPNTSNMNLSWKEEKLKLTNNITFMIFRNETVFYVYDLFANIYLDETHFPNAVNQNASVYGRTTPGANLLFVADAKNGHYICQNENKTVKLGSIDLNIKEVSFIAFNTVNYVRWKNVTKCDADRNTNSPVTTPLPGTTPLPEAPEEASYAGIIAGGVIGGVLGLALIMYLIVMCMKRRGVRSF